LLIASGPEARTHQRGATRGDAAADADAAIDRGAEVAIVLAEGLGRQCGQGSRHGDPKVIGDWCGVHDDGGVEHIRGIPDGLELRERPTQLRAELLLEQGSARTAVAMLARE